MQNRKTLLFFTVLLTLACLYQISFSFVTNSVENKAEKKAKETLNQLLNTPDKLAMFGADTFHLDNPMEKEDALSRLEEEYLGKVAHKPVYPITGKTYQQCKANEMPLGLDLMGGMAVTLEISIPDLVWNLSGKSKNPHFEKAYNTALKNYKSLGEDFITVFEREFKKGAGGDGKLISVFHLGDKERFKANMNDDQVIEVLRTEATNALDKTEYIIANRINKFGVTEPLIQKQPLTGRLLIELPGVKEKLRVRKVVQSTANLEFWETYSVEEFAPFIEFADRGTTRRYTQRFIV